MKNNKFNILLLVGLASLSLVGCNTTDNSDKNNPVSDGGAYNEIEDEDVTSITVFKNDWADFNTARLNNTPIYSTIKNKINCDIEALNSSSGTWEGQLSLLQADGDLPNIFLTNGPDNSFFFNKLIRNEDILPISDWVSEEHYSNIYNYLKQFEFLRSNISYSNGKAWFIPSSWHLEKSLYVRTDWIENLNKKLDQILVSEKIVNSASEITDEIRNTWKYKIPDNLLEFYRLARAFTLYDPDNNGKNDTSGYVSESNKDMDAWIYLAFDAGWDQFIKEGDSYIYSDISDGAMYATAFVTRLISEGYMSIDSLTADNEIKQSRFMNGKAGMMYAHNWYNVIASGLMAASNCTLEEARKSIAIVEPPVGKNGSHGGGGEKGFWQGFCINANMSNSRIRKCLEFYDYLLSDEGYNLLQYGVEGVNYKKNADGTLTNLMPQDADGFYPFLTSYDSASLLYALVDWTMAYRCEVATNADIIVTRQRESERNSGFSDYPCVTTDSYVECIDDCHNLFIETITILEKNDKSLFYDPSDATNYNPTKFSYDDLYNLPRSFTKKWSSFVSNYKDSKYGGDRFMNDYNEYINSGKAKKVTISDYIFK